MGGFCGGGGAAAAPKKVSEASKVVQGTVLAAKGDYKSPKTGFQQVKDDIQMDLGMKAKDVDYYARVDDRAARSKAAMDNLGKDIFGRPASDDSPAPAPAAPAKPKPPAPVAKAPEVPKPPKGTATTATAPKPEEKEGVGIGTAIFGRPASDRSSPAPAAPATPKAPTKVAKAPEVPKPPKPPKGPAKITKAPEPEKKKPADKPGPSEGAAAPLKPDTGAGTTSAKAGQEEAAAIEATAEGEAETKVADTARKGRRKTIATSAKGLLSKAPTRKRRSLMSGLIA